MKNGSETYPGYRQDLNNFMCSFDSEEIATLKSGLMDMRDRLNSAIEKLNDTKGFDKDIREISLATDPKERSALLEKL